MLDYNVSTTIENTYRYLKIKEYLDKNLLCLFDNIINID